MVRIFTLAGMLAVCALGRADEALRRTSVFVEGEDFAPTGPEWVSGEGWHDDIYEANSGNAVLANDGAKGEATKEVVIAADGTYNVWVRYLKVGAYPGTFGLRIEQAGAAVLDGEYRTKPEGANWRAVWEKFEAKRAEQWKMWFSAITAAGGVVAGTLANDYVSRRSMERRSYGGVSGKG